MRGAIGGCGDAGRDIVGEGPVFESYGVAGWTTLWLLCEDLSSRCGCGCVKSLGFERKVQSVHADSRDRKISTWVITIEAQRWSISLDSFHSKSRKSIELLIFTAKKNLNVSLIFHIYTAY
jgi:hypothetical protein